MPHAQGHRGKHPDDPRLFGEPALPTLRRAAEEAAWMLDRGYAVTTVFDVVGGRHQLESRQRMALRRAVCTTAQYKRHVARELDPEDVRGKTLRIDGFNLIILLEVALSGGLVLRGLDGVLRDIAGLRGSYHPVAETDPSLDLVGRMLRRLRPSRAHFWLDAPVSNSGRLRGRILEASASFCCETVVDLVPSADPMLADVAGVVTGDSAILDTCVSWFNFGARAVESVPGAWVVDLP